MSFLFPGFRPSPPSATGPQDSRRPPAFAALNQPPRSSEGTRSGDAGLMVPPPFPHGTHPFGTHPHGTQPHGGPIPPLLGFAPHLAPPPSEFFNAPTRGSMPHDVTGRPPPPPFDRFGLSSGPAPRGPQFLPPNGFRPPMRPPLDRAPIKPEAGPAPQPRPAPPSSQPQPRPEPAPRPEPQPTPRPEPTPVPEPTPPVAPQPMPQPAPEPTPPVAPEPTPPPIAPQPVGPSAQELADLRFLQANVNSKTPDNAEVIKVYERFRLDDATLQELSDITQGLAAKVFDPSNSWLRATTREWTGMDTAQRQQSLHQLMDIMKEQLGLEVDLEFADELEMETVAWRGQYRSADKTVVLNLKDEFSGSFMGLAEVLVHELLHAEFFKRAEGVSRNSVADKVAAGELTTTQGMIILNVFRNMMKSGEDGFEAYQLNPHEQVAFSGHQMWRDLAEAHGFAPQFNIFLSDAPVMKHLQDRGFA
jgi:hypothetical protein